MVGPSAVTFGFAAISHLLPARAPVARDLGWIPLIVGALLVAAGVLTLVRQRRAAPAARSPRGARGESRFRRLTPLTAAVARFAYGGFRLKNLVVSLAAGLLLGHAALSIASTVFSFAFYVALASATVVAPAIVYRVSGDRVRDAFTRLRRFLQRHLSLITGWTLLIVGAVLGLASVPDLI